MKTIVMSKWRYYCPIRGKMIVSRSVLPRDAIIWSHPDAVEVEGTMVTVKVSGDELSNSTSSFLINATLDKRIKNDK